MRNKDVEKVDAQYCSSCLDTAKVISVRMPQPLIIFYYRQNLLGTFDRRAVSLFQAGLAEYGTAVHFVLLVAIERHLLVPLFHRGGLTVNGHSHVLRLDGEEHVTEIAK